MPTNQSNELILIGSLFSALATAAASPYHFLSQRMYATNFHPFIAINIKIYWLKPIYAIDRLKCFCVYGVLPKIKCTLELGLFMCMASKPVSAIHNRMQFENCRQTLEITREHTNSIYTRKQTRNYRCEFSCNWFITSPG